MKVYTLTLKEIQAGNWTRPLQSLRQAFNEGWQTIEPAVRTVQGATVLHAGRVAITIEADDTARDALQAILPQDWELVPPGPPPTLFYSNGPRP